MDVTYPRLSANQKYDYFSIISGQTLDEIVQKLHLHNARMQGWYAHPLKRGAFGYDNLVLSVVTVMEKCNLHEDDDEILATAVHEGWAANYLYWQAHKPWLPAKTSLYTQPAKALNDERRNMCARSSYEDLPEEEKQKDLIIAKWIRENL